MRATISSISAREMRSPSAYPSTAATPALLVAMAGKPAFSTTRALATSQALGRTRMRVRSCRRRSSAARSRSRAISMAASMARCSPPPPPVALRGVAGAPAGLRQLVDLLGQLVDLRRELAHFGAGGEHQRRTQPRREIGPRAFQPLGRAVEPRLELADGGLRPLLQLEHRLLQSGQPAACGIERGLEHFADCSHMTSPVGYPPNAAR